jgi:hypothetical protein
MPYRRMYSKHAKSTVSSSAASCPRNDSGGGSVTQVTEVLLDKRDNSRRPSPTP